MATMAYWVCVNYRATGQEHRIPGVLAEARTFGYYDALAHLLASST